MAKKYTIEISTSLDSECKDGFCKFIQEIIIESSNDSHFLDLVNAFRFSKKSTPTLNIFSGQFLKKENSNEIEKLKSIIKFHIKSKNINIGEFDIKHDPVKAADVIFDEIYEEIIEAQKNNYSFLDWCHSYTKRCCFPQTQ